MSSEDEVELSEKEDNLGPDDENLSMPFGSVATLRTPICELVGHSNAVVSADWFLGGEQAITASWDRTANIWDVNTGELLHCLVGRNVAHLIFVIFKLSSNLVLSCASYRKLTK